MLRFAFITHSRAPFLPSAAFHAIAHARAGARALGSRRVLIIFKLILEFFLGDRLLGSQTFAEWRRGNPTISAGRNAAAFCGADAEDDTDADAEDDAG